jgi:hypothetical protein
VQEFKHMRAPARIGLSNRGPAHLDVAELRRQLEILVVASDELRAHLEARRDLAAQHGDARAAEAWERGALQVARVRNDVRSACHDLDAASVAA